MNPVTPAVLSPWPRLVAWGAVLVSTVGDICWRQPGLPAPFWLTATESLLILVAAFAAIWIPSWRRLARFLFAIALLNLAWDYIAPSLAELRFVRAVTDHVSWGERLLLLRLFTLSGVVLVSLTLIGSGLTRRDLFLGIGNPAAPAHPIRFLGLRKPVPWTWLGPAFIVIFAVFLAPYLYLTVDPNFRLSDRIVRIFPWSFAVAVLNAASEEFQFRCVLLAHLRGIFRPAEAVLLTSVFFGIGHYYGQPSGPLGVLMAGFAGWIWARSMIDTGGGLWAFLIHMVQDVVILSFLAVGAGM
ncbi:MAG TPA: CPBP family intramembrane glutamic endopeptidase [Chthoniobacterales bacterium]|nr:CPBP family intramembrane glutamic endopeptidase [Chthoniobacterales bacterium]